MKNAYLFQLVAFKIFAIKKQFIVSISCHEQQPEVELHKQGPEFFFFLFFWNQLKSENIRTLYLMSTLKEQVQIKSMLFYGTSMKINILLTYL